MEIKVRYLELIITALSDTEYPIVALNYKPDVQISASCFPTGFIAGHTAGVPSGHAGGEAP